MKTIFRKGLLLIAAPVLFQVIFLGILLWIERENAAAERWALHTRVVISQAETALRRLVQESDRVRGLVITGSPVFAPDPDQGKAAAGIGELRRLVSDNPPQEERVGALQATTVELESWIAGVEALVRSGRTSEAAERVRELRGERLLAAAQQKLGEILSEEQRLDQERLARLERNRRARVWLLLGAAVGAAVTACLLAWAFARGISSRLEIVTANARRLAGNEALTPPQEGEDEIAELDATVHRTAERLLAAAATEQRYKTELERRAAELAHTNEDLQYKTREVETFVYSVSHDLRSPLVNLQGFSRELEHSCAELRHALDRAALPADLRRRLDGVDRDMMESVRYIQTAVLRSGNIIDALLRLSRAGRVEYRWQQVDMTLVVHRVVDAMRSSLEQKNARVTAGDLPPCWGDPTALEQVFGNLLSNAVNYLDPARPGRIEIGGESGPGSAVTYWVRDNGLGIPEPYREKLFVAFQRLHGDVAPGEGIGLALVRRVIERHGGKIRVDSKEEVGTNFILTLPGTGGGRIPAEVAGDATFV
ncbi:MAG TPA: ATP-binding protein [Thermoanaerobaculia bacterium]|nr:ATP-binding protein [Thermoanaerobaculia bacterium]